MDVIEKSGIPIRYVLIDDGTIQSDKKERLSSMQPLSNSFPNGFARIIARKNKDKIQMDGIMAQLIGLLAGNLSRQYVTDSHAAYFVRTQ